MTRCIVACNRAASAHLDLHGQLPEPYQQRLRALRLVPTAPEQHASLMFNSAGSFLITAYLDAHRSQHHQHYRTEL
jgi:hypothetical protein